MKGDDARVVIALDFHNGATRDEADEAVCIAELTRRERSSHATNFGLAGDGPQPSFLL
jgi:hypothetical protein